MAAIPSLSTNANPQRQNQTAKTETTSEPTKPSETKNSVSVQKSNKRSEQKSHHPPNIPGVIPDVRTYDPNLFFAGNGYAPHYFFDYSAAGFPGQPALSHLPWEEYARFMGINGADGQAIFNGDLGPVFYQAPPDHPLFFPPPFSFNGGPSMGADGQLYGPHAFHAFAHAFPPGQFIPQASGNETGAGAAESIASLVPSADKSHSNVAGSSSNGSQSASSSTTAQSRTTSAGTVENSVKQSQSDVKADPSKAIKQGLVQSQPTPVGRTARDIRPLEPNQPISFPRVIAPQNGFGRAGRGHTIAGNGFFDVRGGGRGWAPALDNRGKGRGRGIIPALTGDPMHDVANEQNRGPRTVRSKTQSSSNGSSADAAKQARLPETVLQGNYNSPNFPTTYANAKFFVIKSYSEDDVHKSIKYNVWASTPNGNKRLDAAYREASTHKDGCPVFLFFSVNASGQFCGVAEMVSSVDFTKSVEYWQQDKWNGQFKVKWHIIKDVPNGQFRHILLANNENKPVTNSRDTQEVKLEQGLEMLTLFKKFAAKTSILDDFTFYDNRQKAMQEKRAKLILQQRQKAQLPLKQMVSTLHVSDRKDFNNSAGQILKETAKKDERAAVVQPKMNGSTENECTSNGGRVNSANHGSNGNGEAGAAAAAVGAVDKVLTPSQALNSKLNDLKPKSDAKVDASEIELSKNLANNLVINKGGDSGA